MARSDPRNSTEYWWDRHLTGLSLMRADFTTHEYPPHIHEALVVAVTENGGSVVKSRGQVEEATHSTLFVFNPAEPHAGWMGWSERWQYRSMYLTQAALDQLAAGLGIERVPYFTHNIFGRLFQRHGSGGNRIPAAPVDRQLLARVKDRMHANYACELRLEDLAAEVGLTTFQLIGLFKRTVGLTPHAYLTQVRLNMACRRLRHAPVLAEVATGVGFYDQSALNKHFKRCYGITPTQFARAAAAA